MADKREVFFDAVRDCIEAAPSTPTEKLFEAYKDYRPSLNYVSRRVPFIDKFCSTLEEALETYFMSDAMVEDDLSEQSNI
jgi:hypothetical protein